MQGSIEQCKATIVMQGESKQCKVIAQRKVRATTQDGSEQCKARVSNTMWEIAIQGQKASGFYITGLSGRGGALNPKPKFPSSLPNPKP